MSYERTRPEERRTLRAQLRQAFLTGSALTIPLGLTLIVLQLALNPVSQAVSPPVAGPRLVVGPDGASQVLLEAVTVVTLAAENLVIGLVAEVLDVPVRLGGTVDLDQSDAGQDSPIHPLFDGAHRIRTSEIS